MSKEFPLNEIQEKIRSEMVDGWLFYDFKSTDEIAQRILGINPKDHLSRRWFYLIRAEGAPIKLIHKIEPHALRHLPGEILNYAGWKELEEQLGKLLKTTKKIAMHYSPEGAVPYVSRVDAGTIELVRKTGAEVVSAADLIQRFEAVMTDMQLDSHKRAAKILRTIVDEAFGFVGSSVKESKSIVEYDVQQFIWDRFDHYGLESDDRPIAAIDSNSGNPHYSPQKEGSSPVKKDSFLLIDLWAREKELTSVYADITWTGYVGTSVPEEHEEIFQIVRGGRDAALEFVTESMQKGKEIFGAEVDDVCRKYIAEKGFGEFFIHRTGHNIGHVVHGNGANMDNFETKEVRRVMPNTCFSIEPGIYRSAFGVRSEIDVYVSEKDAHVFGQPVQTTVVPILSF